MDKRVYMLANPFQVFMMLACILSGFFGLFTPGESSSAIQRLLPETIQVIWYVGLLLGGILGLYGLVRNMFIERISMTLLAGISIGYAFILFEISPRILTFSVFVIIFFSIACIVRIFQIRRLLKRGIE